MDSHDEHSGPARPAALRPTPVVAAELGEIRRHLRDAPPHHGAGHREVLLARLEHLERELAILRAHGAGQTAELRDGDHD